PATSTRSGRCCPAPPAVSWWSPAVTCWPAWSPPRTPSPCSWTCSPWMRPATCSPAASATRVAAEPDPVDEIITRCARLPLALAIVAAHAATPPRLPLAALADQLRDSHDRLDALSTGDPTTDVRAVFSWSYHALTPQAARLFRLLGLHPGPDITAPA